MIRPMLAALALIGAATAQTAPAAPRPQASVIVTTADYEFQSSYPAKVVAIPALAAFFEEERARIRRQFVNDAKKGRAEAKQDGRPFIAYDLILNWQIVTETPRFLSFSGNLWGFTGGAHGSGSSDTLIWDKARRARMKPTDAFVSPAALWSAIRGPYCQALNVERAERRGRPVDSRSDDPFERCPKLDQLTLLLGSSNRQAINRIGIIADQYVAGAYVEGPYEITLPVTPAVIAAVKPAYRAAFAVKQP